MPYVTVVLGAGLGNRFFQVAAMLGYAEAHGHTPVFVESFIEDNPSHPGPYSIVDLFPSIPILRESVDWVTCKEVEEFTYSPFCYHKGHVRLLGSFQSHLYFPTSSIPCPALLVPARTAADTYFLHVRRGDYLHPLCAHHRVSLESYWERCLSLIPATEATQFLVCSEDMEWCRAELPRRLSQWIKPHQWRFLPPCDDAATLAAMIGCGAGGLCANSSFSWWAAYWNRERGGGRLFFMPALWGHPPMPAAKDLWPPWAVKVRA
jgi:hypothetical protein